jgi:hypothetical protein
VRSWSCASADPNPRQTQRRLKGGRKAALFLFLRPQCNLPY